MIHIKLDAFAQYARGHHLSSPPLLDVDGIARRVHIEAKPAQPNGHHGRAGGGGLSSGPRRHVDSRVCV